MLSALGASAQWSTSVDSPVAVFPTGTTSYATRVVAGVDGASWALVYHPNTRQAQDEYDVNNVVYEMRLQYFDRDGVAQFPDDGLLISDFDNWSYTVVNDYLLADSKGNVIVVVNDCRNSGDKKKSFTAYKVAPDGTMLWGDDGVAVSDPTKPCSLGAMMSMVELEDGSFVFAWCEFPDSSSSESIVCLQRLSADGKPLWDGTKTRIDDVVASYPYLVNGGNNTAILVYGRTASNIIYARKIDFEFENVWGKDVRIYRGGWGSTPLHTILHVTPSGDGGVLVSWADDREAINLETPYLSYVTSDGKLGFAGASDEADCRLAYIDLRSFNVAAVPAADGSCFYAVWRATSGSQVHQAIMMQKISKTGDLQWGDDAEEILPLSETSLGYISVQAAGDDGACAFFEQYFNYYDQRCYAYRFDAEGDPVWENGMLEVSAPTRSSSSLESQVFPGQNAWLLNWTDGGSGPEDKATTYMMTRLNQDGTFGLPGAALKTVTTNASALEFDGHSLKASVADGTRINIYNAAGQLVASPKVKDGRAVVALPAGFYAAATSGLNPVKFIIK